MSSYTPQICMQDCPRCGDAICNGTENANTCNGDCNPVSGNGVCESGETQSTHPWDCYPSAQPSCNTPGLANVAFVMDVSASMSSYLSG